jgi:hypothetical protein
MFKMLSPFAGQRHVNIRKVLSPQECASFGSPLAVNWKLYPKLCCYPFRMPAQGTC